MTDSSIEWTDKTWNPVRGCRRVSPGCERCYAERTAARFVSSHYEGLVRLGPKGPRWTGEVRTVESKLDEPLRWRKPARIFVNSMSDLFHKDVPALFIARVFATMAKAHRHMFQVLTKRADRMREVLTDPSFRHDVMASLVVDHGEDGVPPWPLPNVHLGVSVEDQQRADERIPLLLSTPAAVRFLSCEPLLGPVNLPFVPGVPRMTSWPSVQLERPPPDGRLDWVIVGGESGPGARPCDVTWLHGIVEQCRDAGVPCFVKQLGAVSTSPLRVLESFNWPDGTVIEQRPKGSRRWCADLKNKKGGDPAEWPTELRVREFPGVRG